MNKESAFRRFKNFLQDEGKNITRERLEILDGVLEQKGHFKIEDIIGKMRTCKQPVSRATVYRTIKTIENAGFIKHIRSIHDEKVYEVIKGHHEHMICELCGKIIEFHSEELEALQQKICDDHDFLPGSHSTKIFGICASCRKKSGEKGI
ncbi:MAG: Fur family transcriptional regulator [Candidatus Marinimicrobia bacterium]|nr:Fur family transcriptional regulator [Candidatus Neomarinimicrobiota bacterium]